MATKLDKLIDRIIEIAVGKDTMQKVATEARERIVRRTRTGKGVTQTGAQPSPLRDLTPATVNIRKNLREQGKLTGPGARPSKSAVNRTGAMLDSLKPEAERGQARVVFGSGEQERKADELQSNGFVFMNLSEPEIKGLHRVIKNEIKRRLK